MAEKRKIVILILCSILLTGLSKVALSTELYATGIEPTLEYDDNVTRQGLKKDYQYGIVWRLNTGFGIRNFIPLEQLDTWAKYELGMRDVSTTNDEDYSSHRINLGSETIFETGTTISLTENFELKNSQSDLFNFYDNSLGIKIGQSLGSRTTADLSYGNQQRWFQNKTPEVQAQNFFYHQMNLGMTHKISNDFTVMAGYIHQATTYNRSPIDFRNGKQIVLAGTQQDTQNMLTLGFQLFLFNNLVKLDLMNYVVNSNSNSRAFNFNGNKTKATLVANPTSKLLIQLAYQLVAYELGAYQTPGMGYELGETRTDDQSYINVGVTYTISDQVSLQIGYKHIENTVFFTKEFYKKNTFSTGLKISF